MNTLYSTTQFTGQMGYQKISNKQPHNISHKKANWFEKLTPLSHMGNHK